MTSSSDDEKKLQLECEQLWTELKGLKAQVEDSQLEVAAVNKDDSLGEIYKHKQQVLEAHLKVLKESEVTLPNLSEDTQVNMLLEKLDGSIGEMEETVLFVTEERAQSERKLKFLQTRLFQEEKMSDVLREKLASASAAAGEESEDEILQRLKMDCSKMETKRKRLIKDMKAFVNEHFPTHGEHTLIDTLQLLMNRCVESPHAPYVECDGIWQPYLEMLLRTGIAISHKDNDKLIRLNPFHL